MIACDVSPVAMFFNSTTTIVTIVIMSTLTCGLAILLLQINHHLPSRLAAKYSIE